jgi:hypothetical protein
LRREQKNSEISQIEEDKNENRDEKQNQKQKKKNWFINSQATAPIKRLMRFWKHFKGNKSCQLFICDVSSNQKHFDCLTIIYAKKKNKQKLKATESKKKN